MNPPLKRGRGRPPKPIAPEYIFKAISATLDALMDLTDGAGRILAEAFMDPVSKKDYPEYYKVIPKPMAISLMRDKIEKRKYSNAEEFKRDVDLMVENAKTFNRKGSMIYKDAERIGAVVDEVLPKLVDEFRPSDEELRRMEEEAAMRQQRLQEQTYAAQQAQAQLQRPPVQDEALVATMRDILNTIETRQDDDGRHITEMFKELPSQRRYPDYYQKIKRPIALNNIHQKVSAYQYRTLTEFEADFNQMVANAMTYNDEGSEVYEDAVTLRMVFSELIKSHGGGSTAVASAGASGGAIAGVPVLKSEMQNLAIGGETYEIGDFVYIFNPNDPPKPTVAQILSFWIRPKRATGIPSPGITVCWYLRPEQTVHRASAKFMQNEVFKTNHAEDYFADEIFGRCWVLFIKDYIKGKPKGADLKDVFVCESRYNEQVKQYSKIKNWAACMPEQARNRIINMDYYETPLVPLKIYPAFPGSDAPPPLATPRLLDHPPDPLSALSPKKALQASLSRQSSTPQLQHIAQTGLHASPYSRAAPAPYVAPMPLQMNPTTRDPPEITEETIPLETVDCFETDQGKIKWFPAPPLDVVDSWTATHSLEWLYRKALEKRKAVGAALSDDPSSGKRSKIVDTTNGVTNRGDTEVGTMKQLAEVAIKAVQQVADEWMEEARQLRQIV
ncbi:Bromodomain-containing protein [Gaertneriomyces semiglobifer]|nr:Bromodomain-containing protein [Gaertneriomyces semiglobifer]